MAHACGVPIGAVQKRRTGARRARDDDSPSGHRCPRCHGRALDAVAYAHLLGLHLGDGHMVRVRAVHRLSIFCDNAWPGLIDEAARSMALTMPASSVSRRQRQGCIEVMSYSLHRPCLFPQHGPGRKHEREIKPAPWQEEIVRAHPGRFVRGLIHSDGCRGLNRVRRELSSGVRWYSYPRYHFKNESPTSWPSAAKRSTCSAWPGG